MRVLKPTTVRIEGITYTMRPGCSPIPAPVLSHWRRTGQIERLEAKGVIGNGSVEAVQTETAEDKPRRGRPAKTDEPSAE